VFTLRIDTDNDAFSADEGRDEVARILRNLAEILWTKGPGDDTGLLRDVNGNTVGTWTMVVSEES